VINTGSWLPSEIFDWLQYKGNVEPHEMYRTFNCGIGMVVCVAQADADTVIAHLKAEGEDARLIGEIEAGDTQPGVRLTR
jgi:phosphoribosylformylglycinamidine cyclo-ligase